MSSTLLQRPAWIEDADCGLLIDPQDPRAIADAIAQLLGDDERARLLASVGIAMEAAEQVAANALQQAFSRYGPGDPRHARTHEETRQLLQAATPAQMQKARQVLVDARRALYQILAEADDDEGVTQV